MENITISRNELKKLMRESFEDVLIAKKDLIGDAVVEAMEDIGLARAMEDGRTGERVDLIGFKKKLNTVIKLTK
jgi:hypothetical protein